jgi:hypothetical protein
MQREHLKITSKTTNEQLKEIETRLVKDAKENYGIDKVNGLAAYLRYLRSGARKQR